MPKNDRFVQSGQMDKDPVELIAAEDPEVHVQSYFRFRDLLEAAPDAIIESERDGTIVL